MGALSAVPWWAYVGVALVLIAANRAMSGDSQRGRVVGIVGRMGSGKSYFAVRMAYSRMKRGATIYTNFSMNLDPTHSEPCPANCVRRKRCKCARGCPCQMAARWHRFEGWDQFLHISNAVVIIDEADLYAPSHDPRCISDAVRWKLKMCRKHKIDLYWIAQGHMKVSSLLRNVLTNEIRVCTSWFGGKYFTAKTYQPEHVGRDKKHTSRSGYRLNRRIAGLYDTLETIRGDETRGDGTMGDANAMADAIETKRAELAGDTERKAQVLARRLELGKCIEMADKGGRYCQNKVIDDGRCKKHQLDLLVEAADEQAQLIEAIAAPDQPQPALRLVEPQADREAPEAAAWPPPHLEVQQQ